MIKLYSLNAGLLRRWQNGLEGLPTENLSQPMLDTVKPNDLVILHFESLEPYQLEAVRSGQCAGQIVVLSDTPNLQQGCDLIRQGVRGYSNSYMHETLLPKMVEQVGKGNVWAVPELIQSVLQSFLGQRAPDPERYDLSELSDRELQVFEKLMEGMSNKEIARALAITERTVKAHVGNILKKTGAPDRVHLIVHGTS